MIWCASLDRDCDEKGGEAELMDGEIGESAKVRETGCFQDVESCCPAQTRIERDSRKSPCRGGH